MNLNEELKRDAIETIERRIEEWSKEHFETVLLPRLKKEIRERLYVQLIEHADHMGFEIKFEFSKKMGCGEKK